MAKLINIAVVVLGNGTRLVNGDVGLRLAQLLHGLQPPAELVQVSSAEHESRPRLMVFAGCVECARP